MGGCTVTGLEGRRRSEERGLFVDSDYCSLRGLLQVGGGAVFCLIGANNGGSVVVGDGTDACDYASGEDLTTGGLVSFLLAWSTISRGWSKNDCTQTS